MERPLVRTAAWGLALAVALALAGMLAERRGTDALDGWRGAHTWLGLAGFLLPAVAALHLHQLRTVVRRVPARLGARELALAYGLAAALLCMGHLARQPTAASFLAWGGVALLVAGGGLQAAAILPLVRRKPSAVRAEDPLTKGDDACLAQMRFAHFLLPLGLLLVAVAYWPGLEGAWWIRSYRAGAHLLLAGYALLSLYGLSHLVVPRLSGVPAIAAGAIKGELHASLLGLLLLTSGFLAGVRGLVIAGGAFLFLGAFTWMGVLGANIMRNKSRTQRVTPEFVYVPWAFAAVFWTVSGTLLGIFLNAAPKAFPDALAGLRFVHVHALLFGGFTLLLLGFVLRLAAAALGRPPPTFQRTKPAFYGLNVGLALLLYGELRGGPTDSMAIAGATAVLASLSAYFMSLPGPPKAGPV